MMRCTCQQAAREARKAALEEAAVLCDRLYEEWGMENERDSEGEVREAAFDFAATRIRALANSPEKSDG